MSKKIAIDSEAYHNLLDMLKSTEEDAIVALSTINNVNFDQSVSKVLLLKKLGTVKNEMWTKHASKVCRWFNKIGISYNNKLLGWQEIFDILLKLKVPTEELEFFVQCFSKRLLGNIKNIKGYEFLDDIEITFKYNDTRQK